MTLSNVMKQPSAFLLLSMSLAVLGLLIGAALAPCAPVASFHLWPTAES